MSNTRRPWRSRNLLAVQVTTKGVFEIGASDGHLYWAERKGGQVIVHRRGLDTADEDQVLVQWSTDVLRNLLLWAEDEKSVTFSLTGPLAQQVRELSKELSLTPEMLVWHAVKVFIETGAKA